MHFLSKGGWAMSWFTGNNRMYKFEFFSLSHIVILVLLFLVAMIVFNFRQQLKQPKWQPIEMIVALSLLIFEVGFQVWLIGTGHWDPSDSIPLELCNISLILTVLLLLTNKRFIYELLLFTALLGASQALLTPILSFDFPHFRFIHFFYTHSMMIWVVLYFTWVKGFRPTIWSVLKVFIFLNAILPFILLINKMVDGNYMFLSHKPQTASLLDYLGPYPWYILSLEGLLLLLSLFIWFLLREKKG
jgi:hypothetical integral membrane protein (TIGR02206 family)